MSANFMVQVIERQNKVEQEEARIIKHEDDCMYLVDISDARVSCLCLAMLVKSLDHLPAPLAILGVLGQSPHQEVGLNCFRSQYVISKAKIDTLS